MISYDEITISNVDFNKCKKLVLEGDAPYVFSDKKAAKKLIINNVVRVVRLPLMKNEIYIITDDFVEYMKLYIGFEKL